MKKTQETHYCDKCGRKVSEAGLSNFIMSRINGILKGKHTPALIGVVIHGRFGYSFGGWGCREEKPMINAEVCEDCFRPIESKWRELVALIHKRDI